MLFMDVVQKCNTIVTNNGQDKDKMKDCGVINMEYDPYTNTWKVLLFPDHFLQFCKEYQLKPIQDSPIKELPDTVFYYADFFLESTKIHVHACGPKEEWEQYGVYVQE